jgi:hypothetical protein
MKTSKLKMMVAILMISTICFGATNSHSSLKLEGWKKLTKSEIESWGVRELVPYGSTWRHEDTGAILLFAQHEPNLTQQNIKAAVAGICDSATKKGIIPSSFDKVTLGTVPAFKMTGVMKRSNLEIQTTFIYALGKTASYHSILFEYPNQTRLKIDELIKIDETPNPVGAKTLEEIISMIKPNLALFRQYAEQQSKLNQGEPEH